MGPVILVGTVVPLKIEKVNGCVALSVGGVHDGGVLKVTKAGLQVQVPLLGAITVPSTLLSFRSNEAGVRRFRLDIRDDPPAVDVRIAHTADHYELPVGETHPMARFTVFAVVIVIVPGPWGW